MEIVLVDFVGPADDLGDQDLGLNGVISASGPFALGEDVDGAEVWANNL